MKKAAMIAMIEAAAMYNSLDSGGYSYGSRKKKKISPKDSKTKKRRAKNKAAKKARRKNR